MGTSLSTILAPANLIIEFLFVPRVIYFCAFFAYDGLKNGISLTHFGIRQGVIARIYGVFYLLICVAQILTLPSQLREILAVDPADMKEALLFSAAVPQAGLLFLAFALILFILSKGMIAWGQRKLKQTRRTIRRVRAGRKYMNWMIAMIAAIGIPYLFGLPCFFTVSIFAFFTYFAPFTSPIAIKELMSMPIDEKKPQQKSVSPV